MPAEYISAEVVTFSTGTATPAAQTITIPADATAVYLFWFYYANSDGAGLASATLNGASPGQTFELPMQLAGNESPTGVAAWYAPATGARSLAVTWDAVPIHGPNCVAVYVKDGDITAWRDADADAASGTANAQTILTTAVDDLLLRLDTRYDTSETPPALQSGWTSGATGGQVDYGSRFSYRTAAGTSETLDCPDDQWPSVVGISIPRLPDTVPDAFTFTAQTNVPVGSVRTSNTITVAGIDAAAAVSIAGGTYSKNGGGYTSDPGTAVAGDTFVTRHTSPGTARTPTTTTLTIGGVSGAFETTTGHTRQSRAASNNTTDMATLAVTLDARALSQSTLYWDVVTCNNDTAGTFGTVSSPGWDVVSSVDSGGSGFTKKTRLRRVVRPDSLNGSNVNAEPTTYTATYTYGGTPYRVLGGIVEFVEIDTLTPEDVASATQYNSTDSGSLAAPGLTPVSEETVLLVGWGGTDGSANIDGDTIASPGSMVERTEIIENNWTVFGVMADQVIDGLAATGTRTATLGIFSRKSLAISTLLRAASNAPTGGMLLLSDFGANPGFAFRI